MKKALLFVAVLGLVGFAAAKKVGIKNNALHFTRIERVVLYPDGTGRVYYQTFKDQASSDGLGEFETARLGAVNLDSLATELASLADPNETILQNVLNAAYASMRSDAKFADTTAVEE